MTPPSPGPKLIMLQNIHFNINKIHKPMTVGSKSIKKNPEDMLPCSCLVKNVLKE
jgi:hypothetical protein